MQILKRFKLVVHDKGDGLKKFILFYFLKFNVIYPSISYHKEFTRAQSVQNYTDLDASVSAAL